jgi:hypothetical protein
LWRQADVAGPCGAMDGRHAATSPMISRVPESGHREHRPPIRRWLPMPDKRVQFDDEALQTLNVLARDCIMDFQELAYEAFGDLLKKHGRSHRPQNGPARECEKGRVRATPTGVRHQSGQGGVGSSSPAPVCSPASTREAKAVFGSGLEQRRSAVPSNQTPMSALSSTTTSGREWLGLAAPRPVGHFVRQEGVRNPPRPW